MSFTDDIPIKHMPPSTADGWRGKTNQSINSHVIAAITYAACEALFPNNDPGIILVTHDNRSSSPQFAKIVCAVISIFKNIKLVIAPYLPTPIASWVVKNHFANVAILITASHNPPEWNGIKIKEYPGKSLKKTLEKVIHARAQEILQNFQINLHSLVETSELSFHTEIYINKRLSELINLFSKNIKSEFKIVVDGMNGIAGKSMEKLCHQLGWQVIGLGVEPIADFDGMTPDPSLSISRKRTMLEIKKQSASLGVVLDGDGDRVYVIDDLGRFIQPQELVALILSKTDAPFALHYSGSIYLTVATGVLINHVAIHNKQPFFYFPVGFKNVSHLFIEQPHALAVGGVGDIAFSDFGFDRDPFLVVCILGSILSQTNIPLSTQLDQLRKLYKTHDLIWVEEKFDFDLPVSLYAGLIQEISAIAGVDFIPIKITQIDGYRVDLNDGTWLLIRNSTTESGFRVYGELLRNSTLLNKFGEVVIAALKRVGIQERDLQGGNLQ